MMALIDVPEVWASTKEAIHPPIQPSSTSHLAIQPNLRPSHLSTVLRTRYCSMVRIGWVGSILASYIHTSYSGHRIRHVNYRDHGAGYLLEA